MTLSLGSPYFLLLSVGLALGCVWLVWTGGRRGLSRVVLIDVCIAAVLGGLAGGRLLHVLVEPLPGHALGPAGRAELRELAPELDPAGRDAVRRALEAPEASAAWLFIARMPPGDAREDAIAAVARDPGGVPALLWYRAHPLEVLAFWKGGLAYLGGLALAAAACVLVIRRHGASTAEIADLTAPAVALGLVLGRLGCFWNGCCYGEVCAPHWWATPPPWYDPPVGGVPRYPTALASALFALLLFGVLAFGLLPRRRFRGEVFWAFLVLYAPGRFVIEALRADPRGGAWGLSTSQILALAGGLPALVLWAVGRRRAAPSAAREPQEAPASDERPDGAAR